MVIVNNDALTSLNGLSQLTTIGLSGRTLFGFLSINDNDALTNLNGLENITFINRALVIQNNNALQSLSGLNNFSDMNHGNKIIYLLDNPVLADIDHLNALDVEKVDNLQFRNNPMLSVCNISWVCSYLSLPDKNATIINNAGGCNTREAVENSCASLSVADNDLDPITVYPNPFKETIRVAISERTTDFSMSIVNLLGQTMFSCKEINIGTLRFDTSQFKSGIYLLTIKTPQQTIKTFKLIKH